MGISNETANLNCSAKTEVSETEHKPSNSNRNINELREELCESEASYILGYN